MNKHFFQSLAAFVFLFCSLLSVPASARTLFIDFNNAEREIAVFKQSQQGVASEVVVVPSYQRITHKQRLHILKTNEAIESYTLKLQDCSVAPKRHAKCDGYYDRIYSLEQEREKTTGYYSAEDLKKELLALLEDKNAIPFNMVVISAVVKETSRRFKENETLETTATELDRLLATKKDSVTIEGDKAVYKNTLQSMFPGVPVILASEDNAPTRNEARNLAYIKQVMAIRPKLLAAKSVKEVQPLFQSLLARHWPASLLWKQNVVFFKESTELLVEPVL